MSGSRRKTAVVWRRYKNSPNECARAVELLLSKFVLFDSQARRGSSHDLTNDSTPKDSTPKVVKHESRTTEQEKT